MVYWKSDGIVIREARREDIQSLKDRIRREDAEEVIAAGNLTVEDALAQSFSRSTVCFTVEREGLPVALFGIVPEAILGNKACIWFLGANEMALLKKNFVKMSKRMIQYFLRFYSVLWNTVDSRYTGAVRWLQHIGADFSSRTIVQIGGVKFLYFEFRRI